MTQKVVSGTLASDVADAGTFTVSYPARTAPESGTTDAGAFQGAVNHKLMVNSDLMAWLTKFTLSFGTSSITVTNRSGSTWPAGSTYKLELQEPGKRIYTDTDGTNSVMAAMTRNDAFLINLGAPDAAVTNGYFASQDLTAAGVASTSVTAAAAIAAASLAGVADVPRNVVAAWTGTAILTVTGKDQYGNTIIEKSASGTSFTGVKAFKKVTGISVSANVTSLTVGTGNVIGLPVYLPSRSNVLAEIIDGAVAGDLGRICLPFHINATDLSAGTRQQIPSPITGRVTRIATVVQTALAGSANDIGIVTAEVNGNVITGSSLTTYSTGTGGDGSVGDVAAVDIPTDSANAAVTAGQNISIVPSSTWNSAGALNGFVEVTPTGGSLYRSGTFVTGLTTAGGSTATTADVRGTYTPPFTPDGAKVVQLLVHLPDPGYRGPSQYAG